MAEEQQYPECDKLAAVSKQSQPIGEFLEWLNEQGIHLMELRTFDDCEKEQYAHTQKNTEQLLADFFEIDLKKVEAERQQILASLRENG